MTVTGDINQANNQPSIIGRILPGYVADRIGRFNVMIIMCTFTFLTILCVWVPVTAATTSTSTLTGLLFFVAGMYGLGSGAFVSLLTAIIAQLTQDLRQIGTRLGAHYLVISFATLISNPIAGAILDSQQSYVGLAVFTGVAQIVGTVMIVLSRVSVGGWAIAKKL